MSERKELRLRIEAERKELEARLARLRVEGTAAANASAEAIEKELKELQTHVRDGWDNLTEAAAGKLNKWLDKAKAA
jgi:predicted  nucleic acid-binding Zn-ribbon protein